MSNVYNPEVCKAASSRMLPPYPSAEYKGVKVLLASNSPRRRELLGMIVPTFEIAPSREIDETYPSTLSAVEVPAYLSKLKAAAYAEDLGDDEIIITADTVVVHDGNILGKPKDDAMAIEMLRSLSGKQHTVITGVTLTSKMGRQSDTFTETTRVTFSEMTETEIAEYVRIFRPLDKAGAYGIQEWGGAAGISGIDGCFYNVMGLPLHTLYTHLRSFFAKA